ATVGSRSLALIVRRQPTRVRSKGRNCLGEIAAFGSILRRFVQSFEHLWPREPPMPRRGGGNRIAKFPQNPLILPGGVGRSGNDAQPDLKCLELSPPNPSAWAWSAV